MTLPSYGKVRKLLKDEIKSTFSTKTIGEIVKLARNQKLHPDPIGNRQETQGSDKKGQEIINAVMNRYGVGMITVRDISQSNLKNKKSRDMYPGYSYLTIDGGHRIREFTSYVNNEFDVGGYYFKDLSEEEQNDFLAIEIAFEAIECSAAEATLIFRSRNKTTHVNFMEMVMSDGESQICELVRRRTMFWSEYDNDVHPAFIAYLSNKKNEWKPDCFDTNHLNPRCKWDEYVFIAILKSLGKGNVDAGQEEIQNLVANEKVSNPVTKTAMETVDQFLSDLPPFVKHSGKKFNTDLFNAFQLVWFSQLEKHSKFVIKDMNKFSRRFMTAYFKLTSTRDKKYDNKIVHVKEHPDSKETVAVNLKTYIRSNTKNFSNSHLQRTCAEFFLEEMGDDIGVVALDKKRSLTRDERIEKLALNDYRCGLTGEELDVDDSVWGHDLSWSDGGKTSDGKAINKKLNTAMGKMSIAEYKKATDITDEEYQMILEARRNKVA